MMRDLAREIGIAATLALAELYGGRRIHIPMAPGGEIYAALAGAMGEKAAGKFCRAHAGVNVDIPKCDGARRAARDAEISRAGAAGDSYSALARRFDLTERRIGDILRRGRGGQP